MREISLDRLRTLVAIADQGSFVAAAQLLHLAPPTVSLHVAELESRIGAPLLSRTRGNVQPSTIGAVLVERARRLLAEVESTLDDVERQVQGLTGRVRLGASTGAIAHLLPQAVARLREQHPDIDVQIAVLTSHDTLARLAQGSLDVGLVALPQAAVAGLSIRAWRRDPVLAFLPADWRLPARVTPAYLAARPLILNDATTRLSRLTTEWFALGGHRPEPRIELNYNDAIKSLVAAGYGATLLPHEAGAPLPDPRIVMRPLRPALWRELGIAHRAGPVERSTQHVLDALWALGAR
ncbi:MULTISPECIES: LysR family transcriptional regulator [unclassified Burkholderia]|uniref:LysR family transcriptional regulator n=1 Tax=unclassified Burkholderia TaxID=2613784 RepID=UPI0005CF3137|nr:MULTISPECIES: LysR family transcriptional regulator [unclassified Burkholderia]RQR45154.1 LysR family transcriptional regulator [Burkholderia sp. Bp9131]RQR76852.1 LysR family transcriptional regulator [Burkholderia sp. Bp9015]RQR85915.1 LysR family transcriptional regulator [Burkholderia sp. Bp9011]RQR95354.1 LysR family transcriptional regulator [Burkholderia sp. Bp9010]RQS00679.1 LysR family transcriptional regulator [Burkholderia sp. Bp8994]